MQNVELDVLIIDDDNKHVKTFRSKARKKRIKLNHIRNFKDGIDELRNNFHVYHGVILDAKCFADKEAESEEVLSIDDIDAASHEVKSLAENKGYIPYCINTGYSAKFKKRLTKQGFKVFSKPMENEEVLEYIREQNKAEKKHYFEHKGIMDVFKSGLLNPKYLKRLSESLDRLDSEDESDIKSTASVTRDVMEDLLSLLNRHSILPNDVISWPTNDIAIYLVGKKTDASGNTIDKNYEAPDYISRNLSFIHTITSHYLHSNDSTNSKYAQVAMINSLFELIDWFKMKIVTQLLNRK